MFTKFKNKKYYCSFVGVSKIGGNGWQIIHSENIPYCTNSFDTLEEAIDSVREIRETNTYELIED